MLGVSGAKSFSGFMVAARGVPQSPATPQPAAARAAPGLGESAAPRCLRHRLMDHATPGLLSRSAAARRLGTRAWIPSPYPAPGRQTAHETHSRPAPAGLMVQRPCYSDQVTLHRLPPSAARTRPSPATPPHASAGGLATPPQGSTFSHHTPACRPPRFEACLVGREYHALHCLHVVGLEHGGLLFVHVPENEGALGA